MTRTLLLALTLLAAFPAAAAADTYDGVVIARDAARGTIVTAGGGGSVETLRVARPAAFKLGQRVRATGVPRWDDTVVASSVKRRGRANAAKARFTLVRRTNRSLLVSAGGSLFSVNAGTSQLSRTGAIVAAKLRVAKGKVSVAKAQDVGQASTLELPGIFAGLADGVLRLTNGIAVPVPEGLALERYAGDEARLLVSLGPDGSFTLIAIDKELEAMGYVTAVSPTSITVGGVTCTVLGYLDVSAVAVGDGGFLSCSLVNGELIAEGFEYEPLDEAIDNVESDEEEGLYY